MNAPALYFAIMVFLVVGSAGWSEDSLPPLEGVSCDQLLTPLQVKTGREIWSKDKNKFYYQDDNYDFHFMADLKDGVFTLEAHMQDRDKNIRSRFRASDLFHLAFEHFGHFNVKAIEADWISGLNHFKFHNLKKMGIEPKKAATSTWTGKMAKELGFYSVVSLDLLDNPTVGEKPRVKVRYERPDTRNFLIREGSEELTRSKDIFQYRDPVFGFSFTAMIYGVGTLFISSELIDYEKGIRSKYSGLELYRSAVAYFGRENLNEIEDLFHGKSVIREQIFTHMANGKTPEEAIRSSFSGIVARRLGFSEVSDIEFPWKSEFYQSGQPRHMGGRHLISVKFKRPK